MSEELKIQILKDNENDSVELYFKIIIIGDSFVGKSSLAIRATKDTFEGEYHSTIGFEFVSFYARINDSIIKLQIWDTCGQEIYRSLISSFYRNSSLAIIVYSIDNKESFQSVDKWLNDIKTLGNPDVNIFLIGNKADLEDKREVTKEMASDFCANNRIMFNLETSAKTGFNAENVFTEAAKLLYLQHLNYKERLSRPYSLNNLRDKENSDYNKKLESIEEKEEENDRPRKKRCCK